MEKIPEKLYSKQIMLLRNEIDRLMPLYLDLEDKINYGDKSIISKKKKNDLWIKMRSMVIKKAKIEIKIGLYS